MSPLKSQGLTDVGDAYLYTGFLHTYSVVAADVLATVKKQLASFQLATGNEVFFFFSVHLVTVFYRTLTGRFSRRADCARYPSKSTLGVVHLWSVALIIIRCV